MIRKYVKIIFLTFLVLLVSHLSIYMLPVESPTFTILDAQSIGNEYKISYYLRSGTYDANINVIFASLNKESEDRPIYIYYDEIFASWTSKYHILGLVNHLMSEAYLRGYSGNIVLLNADKLQEIMISQEKAVIIIPTTVIPPTVFSTEKNLITPWIESGGYLIYIGDQVESQESLFSFKRDMVVLTNCDSIAGWSVDGIPHSSNATITVDTNDFKEGNGSIKISHSDLSIAGEGFGASYKLGNYDISDKEYIEFWTKVSNMTYLESVYFSIGDVKGGYRHYYLFPKRSTTIGSWTRFLISINNADQESLTPLDLTHIHQINIIFGITESPPPRTSVDIWIDEIKFVKVDRLISTPLPADTEATIESNPSKALDLKYGYVQHGASVETLLPYNGTILGKIYGHDNQNRTAIAMIPIRDGRLVLFGDKIRPPFQENIVAHDIMQILQSGILHTAGQSLRFKNYNLESNTEVRDTTTLTLQRNEEAIVIFVFSKDPYYFFYKRTLINKK